MSNGIHLSSDVFARLVGSAGDDVLLFEVGRDFVDEDYHWSDPVRYRFLRTASGLLSMELRKVDASDSSGTS
jgi:hypothetical protein